MTSEAEVERQIRKALLVRAARVHLRVDDEPVELFFPRAVARRESPDRRPSRRSWGLAIPPAVAALIAAIVVLGTWPSSASQRVVVPSAAATIGPASRGMISPPARSAGGGVVLAWQGRPHVPAEASPVASGASRACGLQGPAAMVHGLRSPDCLD